MVQYFKEQCPPVSIQLNLTNYCACKCIMCKKHEWKLGSIEPDIVINLLDQFKKLNVESIVLSGGDPFAYHNILHIIEEISKRDFKLGILTAGNIQFDYWTAILPKLTWLRFSIDAYDQEQWSHIRGSSRYDVMRQNLETVSKLGHNDKVRLNFCKIKNVNEDQEEKVRNLANELGFGFAAHDVRTFEEFMHKQDHHSFLEQKCIVPYVHCLIESDGSVFPCCTVMNENDHLENVNFEYVLGNIKDFNNDFGKLWFSEKANEMKNMLYNNRVAECSTCPERYYSSNIEYSKAVDKGLFL